MPLPVLRIKGDEGQHIDGRFKHIQASVCANMMEAVSWITSLHIQAEGFPVAVGAALVGVAGNTICIRTNKHGVVIFNLRFHSRDGRTDGVDYQCYTSVNRGSVAKRLNKGISIEHSCESPYIQGWKLEMMAEQVFDRYIENADKVMDLSYAMLEKHIADQEELPDNIDVIRRKQGEIKKLMNKRTNLIEMRAEGDIDKEMFRSKKQEIEDRVAKLTEEIKGLQPEKEQTSNEDYSVKLLELRERLKEYTGFDYSVIPESIVEAFIERIWVSKDEFRWYLRTGNNADSEFDPDDHIKIGAFTLTINDAKKYIYSFSTRRRVYKWADLNVSVWI